MNEDAIVDAILQELNEETWKEIEQNGINHIYPSGMTALGLAVYYYKEENAHFLLEKGADPNIFGDQANPPLLDAYISFCPRLFILLLMYGADPKIERRNAPGDIFMSPMGIMRDIGSTDFLDTLFTSYNRDSESD